MMEHILIIGGGPAAISMARTLQGKKRVTIIRPEPHSMIYCAMPYVLEGIIPEHKSFKKDSLVTDTGAVLIRDEVTKVDFKEKCVHTKQGKLIAYDKLVIATGADPVIPSIMGSQLNGVFSFKTEEDMMRVAGYLNNGLKKAVVVGAGAIGIELAQALNARGVETHLVDLEEHILPNLLDREMVTEAERELISLGIYLHLGRKVVALRGESFVKEVVLDDNESLRVGKEDECSNGNESSGLELLVIFAVGMKPHVKMFEGTGLALGKDGILVNDKMGTNIQDVYAVGDCVQYKSAITGEVVPGKLATNAVPMGKLLARYLLGSDESYSGFYNGAATKVGKYFLGGTGLSERAAAKKMDIIVGYADLTTAFPIMPFAGIARMKLIAERASRKIVGGQIVSEQPVTDKVDLITMSIQSGFTVEELRLFSYSSQPYQSYYPAGNLLVNASEDLIRNAAKVNSDG
jgi:NADH dehydrogenase/NADH oxidase (H2O2-forming)